MNPIWAFIKTTRPTNLLIIVITMLAMRHFVEGGFITKAAGTADYPGLGFSLEQLSGLHFTFLTLIMVFLAASGNIINDYFDVKAGVPTGINPFQFPETPKLREFLNELVIACATDPDQTCSSEEQNQIKNAVDTVLSLPFEQRRFSAIIQSLPKRGGNELYQRLLKCS